MCEEYVCPSYSLPHNNLYNPVIQTPKPSSTQPSFSSSFNMSSTTSANNDFIKMHVPNHHRELHQFVEQIMTTDLACLADVTLTLDDGQSIKAHKLILCAHSSYFRQILTQQIPHFQYPVIVIKDVQYVDLKLVLEFMYLGYVYVPKERQPMVINCAKILQVKGILNLFDCGKNNVEQTDRENPIMNSFAYISNGTLNSGTLKDDMKKNGFVYNGSGIEEFRRVNVIRSISSSVSSNDSGIFASDRECKPSVTAFHHPQALDLSNGRRLMQSNSLPIYTINGNLNASSHHSFMRSISLDESQLRINSYAKDSKVNRPLSVDRYMIDKEKDSQEGMPFSKGKKKNLNLFHAAKYRVRKKAKIEALFQEEADLRENCEKSKVEIEKLESMIFNLILQHARKRPIQSSDSGLEQAFSCPVCGNVQKDVVKMRNHINLLHHEDTESLMKFLMLHKSSC